VRFRYSLDAVTLKTSRYIDDVATAFVLAAERNDTERFGIYNVGTGTQTKLRDAVRISPDDERRVSREAKQRSNESRARRRSYDS